MRLAAARRYRTTTASVSFFDASAAVAVRATVSSGKKQSSQRAVTAEGWGILESALIASFFTRRSGWESVAATCGARSGIPRVPRTVIMFRTMYQRESVRFSRIVGTATLPIRVTISTIAFRTSRSSSSARAWSSGPTERSSSATSTASISSRPRATRFFSRPM